MWFLELVRGWSSLKKCVTKKGNCLLIIIDKMLSIKHLLGSGSKNE